MARDIKISEWKGEPFRYAHVKRDGMWLSLVTDKERRPTAWSRMPRNYTDKVKNHPTFQAYSAAAPPLSTMWCEAYVLGGDREDVKAAIRDEVEALQIECFAIDRWHGEEHPVRDSLEAVSDICTHIGVSFVPYLVIPDCSLFDPHDIPDGQEGWVLKDGNKLNWRRVKRTHTADLRIIGFTEARLGKTGKFAGLIGAVILADSSGREVAQVSGMTDEVRQHITMNRALYMNQVVEVSHKGRGKAGGLQHPQWVGIRWDKDECDTL